MSEQRRLSAIYGCGMNHLDRRIIDVVEHLESIGFTSVVTAQVGLPTLRQQLLILLSASPASMRVDLGDALTVHRLILVFQGPFYSPSPHRFVQEPEPGMGRYSPQVGSGDTWASRFPLAQQAAQAC